MRSGRFIQFSMGSMGFHYCIVATCQIQLHDNMVYNAKGYVEILNVVCVLNVNIYLLQYLSLMI